MKQFSALAETTSERTSESARKMRRKILIASGQMRGKEKPMDLIKRQDAIDALDCMNGTEEVLRSLPPADEYEIVKDYCHSRCLTLIDTGYLQYLSNGAIPCKQQWIPVNERLPETTDEVLTTYIVNGNRKKRFVETATYYDGDEGYWSSPWDEYRIAGTKVEVIAWMELPTPWKESEDKG